MPAGKGDRLKDKVAIVTGAGTRGSPPGIGQAASILMARQGAKVLLADYDIERAEATRQIIENDGGTASVFEADVTDEDRCKEMVETCCRRYGAVHVLFNNAGTYGRGKVTEFDEEEFDRAIAVSVKGTAFCCKYAIPKMIEAGGGSIINMSSVDGIRAGWTTNVPYSVAKGGIVTLTRLMAVHHGRDNIRTNAVAPGHVHGAFVRKLPEEARELRRKAGPLGTEGNAWDVAWAVVFLASDEARWISGVVLPIDAGLLGATPLSVWQNLNE